MKLLLGTLVGVLWALFPLLAQARCYEGEPEKADLKPLVITLVVMIGLALGLYLVWRRVKGGKG